MDDNLVTVYEVVQLLTGETYIYRGGYKEEADAKDIFKFEVGITPGKQISYNFLRLDFNPAVPKGKVRLNRAVIALAWYVDSNGDVVRNLEDAAVKMDAAKAGLILPGGN